MTTGNDAVTMGTQPDATGVWQEAGRVLEGADELAALESLVREHSRFLFKVAYGVLRNLHDAEDVVQEVFLRLYRSGAKDVVDMRAWLASIAFRLAIDRTRKPQAARLVEVERRSDDPDAERVAIHRQQVDRVSKLIVSLPEKLRYPLILSALKELNSREIAGMLGITEASVRGRIFRARQLLKEKLAMVTEGKP
jgi:RNA polymerase sigma-70 factor (ECF subfamily)